MAVRMGLHLSNETDIIYDACVIGAGASGLVCAATMARRGLTTLLVDQNKKNGRKLYATGNGRCNLANAVISDSAYYSDPFAGNVVTEASVRDLFRYLEAVGLPLTVRDGYYYPQSLQASSVVWALTDEARLAGVNFLYEEELMHAERTEEGFRLQLRRGSGKLRELRCHRLALCMGSPAQPSLGAAKEQTVYSLLEELKLPYRPFTHALCPMETEEDVSELAGVRVKTKIILECTGGAAESKDRDTEDIASVSSGIATGSSEAAGMTEQGELQLTEYGISGIAVFNLSTLAKAGDTVRIDLLPLWEREEELITFLRAQAPDRSLYGVMNGLLQDKLCRFHLCGQFGSERLKLAVSAFTDQELLRLIRELKNWKLTVSGFRTEQAQAFRGGVDTGIMDPEGMLVKGSGAPLAVTGELLDVVGRCGGYNLSFAMISGMRAGEKL